MKLATFTYTDTKSKVTNRKILVTAMPSDKISGLDVADLSDAELENFLSEYKEYTNMYLQRIDQLKEAYDLKYNFRQFFQDKTQNVEYTTV